MVMVLIFVATLLAAVLISGLAQRSVLSTTIFFLLVGFVMGRGVLLLAFPVVLVLLNIIGRTHVQVDATLGRLALGVGLGIAVPWVLLRFERIGLFSPATAYEPLNAFGLGLLIFALGSPLNANLFLMAPTFNGWAISSPSSCW